MPRRAGESGFVLIALIALLAMGGLYFFISNLTPEAIEARRQAKTEAALMQAREALIGYAVRYREDQINDGQLDRVYGYLPLPDLGSSNNNNIDPKCKDAGNNPLEGCDAASNTTNYTVIGRFPWRTLGTEPLRDGNGECLWYIVSGSHDRIQRPAPMNWDTLGHLDVVTTTDTEKLKSLIASPHDRPVAIIFSAGPQLGTQNRGPIGADVVTECGGNYNPSNYLDPNLTSTLLDYNADPTTASAYYAGGTSTDTATINLAIATQGRIVKEGATTLKKACTPETSCEIVANDTGLSLTSEALFRTVRNSSTFHNAINEMLNRMAPARVKTSPTTSERSSDGCLRDAINGGLLTFTNPPHPDMVVSPLLTDKVVGRIPAIPTCPYDSDGKALGFYTNYADQFFVAKCTPACTPVTELDDKGVNMPETPESCAAVVVFGNMRTSAQSRIPTPSTDRSNFINYLEGINLNSFTNSGSTYLSFSGPSMMTVVSPYQLTSTDIVRCIPAGPSQTTVGSPSLSLLAPGVTSLASYAPASQTLTLGVSDVQASSANSLANTLFGCSWAAEPHSRGNGFRTYFRFKIRDTGDGFTFAIVDADRNSIIANRCGAARQHLGYSGNNTFTLPIEYPKIAIEFDTSRNAGFVEAGNELTNGRNDPCYRSSCPPPNNGLNSDSHVAIMYWGHQAGTAAVTFPDRDDNVHGIPGSDDPASRPAPRNATPVIPHPFPAPYPPLAISPEQRLRDTTPVNRDFHVRVEVTPQMRTAGDESVKRRAWKIEAWLVPTSAKAITNIAWTQDLDPATGIPKTPSSGTVTITAPGHDFGQNDTIFIREAPSAFNGNFIVTASDQVAGTFKFAKFPDPGSTTFSGQPVAMKQTLQVSRMKTTSSPMSQLSPVIKYNICSTDGDCGSSQSCSGADPLGDRYCYAGHQPTVYDQQYIYDIDNGDGTYQDALKSIYLGFTIGVGSNDQVVDVSERFTTWLP